MVSFFDEQISSLTSSLYMDEREDFKYIMGSSKLTVAGFRKYIIYIAVSYYIIYV